ncbi:hypothetical protein BR93DRAFT_927486 [Coniochaeta sp. PMI_546]|nr:hypothetical protein BR93DRAFT_927486 [Coniochaeta sp. PMI_546]
MWLRHTWLISALSPSLGLYSCCFMVCIRLSNWHFTGQLIPSHQVRAIFDHEALV